MREDGGGPLTRVVVRLAAVLRQHAGGAAAVEVDVVAGGDGDGGEPVTVAAVLDALDAAYPAVGRRLRDEAGVVRRHVNVFVGSDNQRDLDGVDTVVPPGVDVSLMPAVSGG